MRVCVIPDRAHAAIVAANGVLNRRLAAARAKCDENTLSHYFNNLWVNLAGGITFWTIFGLIANALFASRFLVQWYVSEKLKRSVIPVQFWWLSIAGSLMMLIYAVYIGKVPLILGFLFPTVIYVRNLMLIRKNDREREGEVERPSVKS